MFFIEILSHAVFQCSSKILYCSRMSTFSHINSDVPGDHFLGTSRIFHCISIVNLASLNPPMLTYWCIFMYPFVLSFLVDCNIFRRRSSSIYQLPFVAFHKLFMKGGRSKMLLCLLMKWEKKRKLKGEGKQVNKVTSSAYKWKSFLSMFISADYLCKLMFGKRYNIQKRSNIKAHGKRENKHKFPQEN